LLAIVLPVSVLLGGCTSSLRFPAPSRPPATAEPWRIPAEAHPTQRLYRVRYEGPEEEASFKLTLYLAAADRYRMTAADGLGRKLWTLDVASDGEAVWLDHRAKSYCRAPSARRLTLVPLADLPLAALPKLLLGRMPAEPATDLVRGDGHLSYRDARGQRWAGGVAGGRLDWWSLGRDGEAVAWWRRDGDGGDFIDRRGRQTIRWQESVREPLPAPLEPLEVPDRFQPGDCDAASR